MEVRYDERYHLHIGYYENERDFESVALKRETEDIWDVYFDFKQYGLKSVSSENSETIKDFGTRIFSMHVGDLEYAAGAERFEKWLVNQKII
ncbi:DUF3986 family protein [Metabacillus sp. JX24]|uniref:DUF3986 family protein n=1 Tax=Metabacillus sp. JX24 TaxID=3240759 RepID=UPI00350F074E